MRISMSRALFLRSTGPGLYCVIPPRCSHANHRQSPDRTGCHCESPFRTESGRVITGERRNMSFKNTFISHDRIPEVTAWIEEERVEQEERFRTIVKQMDELDPEREKWYQEFFDRLTTIGFNQDGDLKVKIAPEDLPVKPAGRTNQVIFKYGVDDE